MTNLRERLARRYTSAVAAARDDVLDQLRQAAPYRTEGSIVRSLEASAPAGDGFRFSLTVGSPAPQALWTEEGTRPHLIVANRARVLRFEVGGETIYRRSVNHPGTPAQHWFAQPMPERWRSALERGLATAGF